MLVNYKIVEKAKGMFEQYVATIYQTARLQEAGLDQEVFQKALTGYFNLRSANKLSQNSSVITVVDFNKPSSQKRMWIKRRSLRNALKSFLIY